MDSRGPPVGGGPLKIPAVYTFLAQGMVLLAIVADPARAAALESMHLTRLGRTDDVASAALFLASDEAGFVTGVSLSVDGGSTARMGVPGGDTEL